MPKHYYTVEGYQARQSVGYLLRRAAKLISGNIESLFVKEEMSFVQWVILMHLREGLSETAAELSQNLCHDSGAITRVIDQLEDRGLLKRKRSSEDRRVVALELTSEGRKATNVFLPRVVALYNELLSDFSTEDADQLIDLLTRLTSKLLQIEAREG